MSILFRVLIYWIIFLVIVSAFSVLLVSCTLTDPSQWRPEQHMMVSRNCRVVCRPGLVLRYDSMDGSCECQPTQKERK